MSFIPANNYPRCTHGQQLGRLRLGGHQPRDKKIMIGATTSFLPCTVMLVLFVAWIYDVIHSDEKCDPEDDCESCPFPCKERKAQKTVT